VGLSTVILSEAKNPHILLVAAQTLISKRSRVSSTQRQRKGLDEESANGAFYTSLGRSPRISGHIFPSAESAIYLPSL